MGGEGTVRIRGNYWDEKGTVRIRGNYWDERELLELEETIGMRGNC